MARCLIACGSNQGRPRQHLDDARDLLRSMPGVTLVAASRARETRPVGGPAGQASFLNGAFLVETDLPPTDVLGVLTAIESTLHRERSERWGPRTIDLDLLLYDDLVIDEPGLAVPHPRMTTRRFVLEPAAEIAPDLVHPVAGCTVRDLLENISAADPHVAVVGAPGSGVAEVAAAVAGSWLDTTLLDAQELLAGERFVRPNVLILVVAAPAVLAQRLAFDAGRATTDAGAAATAVAEAPPANTIRSVSDAVALQGALRHRLLGPPAATQWRPRAVVVVVADNLEQAIGEAVAAVEAMA